MERHTGSLRILISSGPTREAIDPVRFISNYSTGYMGAQLAREALARGHQVTVVSGPAQEPLPSGASVVPVESAQQMEQALRRHAPGSDVVIMAAAVSDFRLRRRAGSKLPRRGRLTLALEATPDLIGRLPRRPGQVRVGFAVESKPVLERAARKLRRKRLDLLVAQHLEESGMPFGQRAVRAWLLAPHQRPASLGTRSKSRVARALLDKIEGLWYGQRRPTRSTGQRTRSADVATT